MKLLNSLYKIVSKNEYGSSVRYDIFLDANSFIYLAHFPREPITPGVCIIQIAKELLENHLNKTLNIRMVKNVKFLNVVSPVDTPQIIYEFDKVVVDEEAKSCKVQALVLSGDTLLAKLSFICSE